MIYDKYLNILLQSKNANFTCDEACISLVANFLNCDCFFLFRESLYFGVADTTDWEKGIFLKDPKKDTRLLFEKINGIKITEYRSENLGEFIRHYRSLDTDLPIMLYTDDYYCSWTPYYMNTHGPHCILIVGINESSHSFFSVDPLYSDELLEMHFNVVKNVAGFRYISFALCDADHLSKDHLLILKELINHYHVSLINEDYYETMLKLIQLFYEESYSNISSDGYYLNNLPLLSRLKLIKQGRDNYALLLSGIRVKLKNETHTTDLINRCYELSNIWHLFRTVIIKYTLKNDCSKLIENSKELMQRILLKECELCKSLIDFYNYSLNTTNQ